MRSVILLPTLNRPDRLQQTLRSIIATAPMVDVCVVTDKEDSQSLHMARSFDLDWAICPESRMGSVHGWNVALRASPDYDLYIMGADDLVFQPGWYAAALAALAFIGGEGVVGFNGDRGKPGNEYAEIFMMTRKFLIEHNGGVFAHPHYRYWGIDVEACGRARAIGQYIYAEDAHVKHIWTGAGAAADQTYKAAKPYLDNDVKTIERCKAAGWPNEWEPILGGMNGTLE